mgnify:CR=1 FL=1
MNAQTTAKQTSKMSQIGKTRYMVQVAMLGAAAVVLMFFDIPLPFAPSFYKIDLSEVPVLIGAFAMGPLAGAAIELIKILLNLVMKGSTTAGVGEVANFLIGCAYVMPAAWIYKTQKTKKNSHDRYGSRNCISGSSRRSSERFCTASGLCSSLWNADGCPCGNGIRSQQSNYKPSDLCSVCRCTV